MLQTVTASLAGWRQKERPGARQKEQCLLSGVACTKEALISTLWQCNASEGRNRLSAKDGIEDKQIEGN